MKELKSYSTRIQLAGDGSPEDERRRRQVIYRLADDLIEKAHLLRSLCSENCAVAELEKTRRSFKSKQLEALRKRLCQELVRM